MSMGSRSHQELVTDPGQRFLCNITDRDRCWNQVMIPRPDTQASRRLRLRHGKSISKPCEAATEPQHGAIDGSSGAMYEGSWYVATLRGIAGPCSKRS